MTIEEIYPYWNDAHADLIFALEQIDEAYWSEKPPGLNKSIRQIVLNLIEREHYWIGQIAQGRPAHPVAGADFPTKASLIEGLKAAREATIRYLDMLKYESLRAVRTIPADPAHNIPESNMPVSWIIWRVMENEIFHWGQIMLIAESQAD
jgi:uncharacterized damage-inducible protein DinB